MSSGAEVLNGALAAVARSSWTHRLVRLAMLADAGLVARVMVAQGGQRASVQVFAWLVVGLAVVAAAWPGTVAMAWWGGVVGFWVLTRDLPAWQVGCLLVLAWLMTRLVRFADSGPTHAVVEPDARRLVVRDAAVEAGWLAAAIGFVTAAALLGRVLPGGPWWTVGLLATLVGGGLAWRSQGSRVS